MAEPLTIGGWDFSPDQLMQPGEVARAFGIDPRTLAKNVREGRLAYIRTPGGQRRYSRQQVEHIMRGGAL